MGPTITTPRSPAAPNKGGTPGKEGVNGMQHNFFLPHKKKKKKKKKSPRFVHAHHFAGALGADDDLDLDAVLGKERSLGGHVERDRVVLRDAPNTQHGMVFTKTGIGGDEVVMGGRVGVGSGKRHCRKVGLCAQSIETVGHGDWLCWGWRGRTGARREKNVCKKNFGRPRNQQFPVLRF